jgi:predicted outer membrane lipoprotein
VAPAVVLGLLFAFAATFVSMALLVRTSFGRAPHAITSVPVALVLYNLWVSAWFVFECLRQFLLTAITPAAALRLVAFVFLAAAFLSLAFLYGCTTIVHQLLGGTAARLLGYACYPLALVAWVWLLAGARSLTDAPWRARVRSLALACVGLFSVIALASAVRDRLEALHPALPLVIDILLALAYTLITVLWVESVEKAARPGGGAAGSMPSAERRAPNSV